MRFPTSRGRVSGSSERLWNADLQASGALIARRGWATLTASAGGRVRTSLRIRGGHQRGGGGRCERFRLKSQTLKLAERVDLRASARGSVHVETRSGWKNNQRHIFRFTVPPLTMSPPLHEQVPSKTALEGQRLKLTANQEVKCAGLELRTS